MLLTSSLPLLKAKNARKWHLAHGVTVACHLRILGKIEVEHCTSQCTDVANNLEISLYSCNPKNLLVLDKKKRGGNLKVPSSISSPPYGAEIAAVFTR
jgi:hypothetical protein